MWNLIIINDKCTISTETLNIMGYVIHNGTIKPDLERLRPLKELDPRHNLTSQRNSRHVHFQKNCNLLFKTQIFLYLLMLLTHLIY